ncbi:MAG: amidohydrolase family protein [Planctomycetota bacterium]
MIETFRRTFAFDGRRTGAGRSWVWRFGAAWIAVAAAGGPSATAADGFLVVRAKHVITAAGVDFTQGTVVIDGAQIRLVGDRDVEVPAGSRRLEAGDEYVMPGLVLARTRHSLPRYARSGNQSHRSAAIEIYPDEVDFDELLARGFTTVAFYPDGAGIPGRATICSTGGPARSGEKLEDSYLRISMANPASDKGTLSTALAKAKEQIAKIAKAREEWEKKQTPAPAEGDAKPAGGGAQSAEGPGAAPTEGASSSDRAKTVFVPPSTDARLQFFVDWLEKKPGQQVAFELSRPSDLVHLEEVLAAYPELSPDRFYLTPDLRPDHRRVLDRWAALHPKVMLAPRLFQLPETVTRFDLVGDLVRSGCEVSFVPEGDGASDFEALRGGIADLVRVGVERATLVRGLTLHPARFLGIEDRCGSLEKGKRADLVFFDGDPLDPASRVTRVMIGGTVVWERGRR